MRYIKLLAAGDVIVAVEALEEPEFVREEAGHKIRCTEYYAQGVLVNGETIQLAGKPPLSGEQLLAAVFIAEDEYDNLRAQIETPAEEPVQEEPETPEEPAGNVLTNAQIKAMLLDLQRRIAAQEETSDFLGGCIMEMGEVVYG